MPACWLTHWQHYLLRVLRVWLFLKARARGGRGGRRSTTSLRHPSPGWSSTPTERSVRRPCESCWTEPRPASLPTRCCFLFLFFFLAWLGQLTSVGKTDHTGKGLAIATFVMQVLAPDKTGYRVAASMKSDTVRTGVCHTPPPTHSAKTNASQPFRTGTELVGYMLHVASL